MSKKLDSVRRSLFREYENDDHSLDKLCNKTEKPSRTSIKINGTFIAVAVILTVIIAGLSNKVLQALLRDVSAEAVNKYNFTVNWTQNNYAFVRDPLFFGTLISIFTMMIIYFDSDIPGVSPPTPFSPRKANRIRYSLHKEKTNHLGFLMSILSGVVTFFLLYL